MVVKMALMLLMLRFYTTLFLDQTTIVENVAVKVTTESAKGNVRTYEALANYQDELGTITAKDEKGMTVIGSTYNIGATAAEVETLVDKDRYSYW